MALRFVGRMMALGVAGVTIAATDADNGFTKQRGQVLHCNIPKPNHNS